jgi:hypothetical protein
MLAASIDMGVALLAVLLLAQNRTPLEAPH